MVWYLYFIFFFNDTATTEIYTLSLHDALPISPRRRTRRSPLAWRSRGRSRRRRVPRARTAEHLARSRRCRDRKSTRLNSSHANISYAVFCLKKKKKKKVTDFKQIVIMYIIA